MHSHSSFRGTISHTFAIASALIFGFTCSAMVYANHHKVDVCHMDEYGAYVHINIAGAAFQAHLGHGDSIPGDLVPGSDGWFSFAEDCTVIPGCPCLVDLPADWEPVAGISGTNIEDCEGGGTVSDVFGSWFDDQDNALGFFKDEICDSPTHYECSAGGITREISEAQFGVCSAGGVAP